MAYILQENKKLMILVILFILSALYLMEYIKNVGNGDNLRKPEDGTNMGEVIAHSDSKSASKLNLRKRSAAAAFDSELAFKNSQGVVRGTRGKPTGSASVSENNSPYQPQCDCGPLQRDATSLLAKDVLHRVDPASGRPGWEALAQYHPNLPLELISGAAPRCKLCPGIFSISWANVHWQEVRVSVLETYYLYSAFYDNRTKAVPSGGSIRIVALLDGNAPSDMWCHLWYDYQTQPVLSKVLRTEFFDYQERNATRLQPVLLTCAAGPLQQERARGVPVGVSLVVQPCDRSRNVLKVIGKPSSEVPHLQQEPQYDDQNSSHWRVAVCGPSLFFLYTDYSLRLVEWLEMVKALGVSQVFFYTTRGIHPNIEKVLQHYEQIGFVELVDFHYPPPYMDEPVLRRSWTLTERERLFALEAVTFTDCALRYKDRYRFLAHFDPDEVPVLLRHASLPHLLASLAQRTNSPVEKSPPVFSLSWSYFPLVFIAPEELPNRGVQNISNSGPHNGLQSSLNKAQPEPNETVTENATPSTSPNYLTILRNTRRIKDSKRQPKHNVKPILDTHDVTGVSSHMATYCAAGACRAHYLVPPNLGFLGHFRYPCIDDNSYHNITVEEPQVALHRRQVITNMSFVLKKLNLLP